MKAVKSNKILNILPYAKSLAKLDLSGVSSNILDIAETAISIPDRIFLAKVEKFLQAPLDYEIEIEDFIFKIKAKNEYEKLGDNIFITIESLNHLDKCYYYGKLFIAYLEGIISQDELQETTYKLTSIPITTTFKPAMKTMNIISKTIDLLTSNNKSYFLNNLHKELYSDLYAINSNNADNELDYLKKHGFLRDISGNFGIDYNPFSKRIAFMVWCYLKINDDGERALLEEEIEQKHNTCEKFKLMCDFFYRYDLHKLEITHKHNSILAKIITT